MATYDVHLRLIGSLAHWLIEKRLLLIELFC